MEKKTTFRVRVMKYAWTLWRTTKQTWRECMLKAWELYRLAKQMRQGAVTFYYRKTDGSIRKAIGTLLNLPSGVTAKGKKAAKPSYKTFAYLDLERNAFRCFKVENLISVRG